jgi:proline dehydrogenase
MTALAPDACALLALSSSIVESRKDPRTPAKHAVIPFPVLHRIKDLDVISKLSSTDRPTALTPAQISSVCQLYDNLVKRCTRAQERGIEIIIDAEYRYVVFLFSFPIFHIL